MHEAVPSLRRGLRIRKEQRCFVQRPIDGSEGGGPPSPSWEWGTGHFTTKEVAIALRLEAIAIRLYCQILYIFVSSFVLPRRGLIPRRWNDRLKPSRPLGIKHQ